MVNLKGINCKNKHHVKFPEVPSTTRPIHHGPDVPVLEPDGNMKYSSDFEHNDMTFVSGDDAFKPVALTAELDDLTRDINLSNESSRLLGSCLKEKYLLAPGTMFYWYRDSEIVLRQCFTSQDIIIGLLQQYCWIDQINGLRV